ncbi:acyltransferase [Ferrimonas senticii]|uniref:acyltransferase n=1 Tax=Ferrimonas senticii TaxID=394566 RepID=UPI00040674D2|nr:acyltransferase [Ferrimonas senticii]
MLSFLPGPLIAFFILSLCIANLMLWGCLVLVTVPLKLLPPLRLVASRAANGCMHGWVLGNELVLKAFAPTQWHIQGLSQPLSKDKSYLIICNHLSAMDIAAVTIALRHHVPMLKFFLKQQLLYFPFLGLACWALDMPFMRRYSKSDIAKDPKRGSADIETTRQSCEKFRGYPTCVINFVEGSRLTLDKHRRQRSPYHYLLKPKSGGIAFAMATLGDQFDQLLDLTVVYPGTPDGIMAAFVSGKVPKVVIDIDVVPMTQVPQGDYQTDKGYRVEFQQWLNQRWLRKDKLIDEQLRQHQPELVADSFYQALTSD